MDVFLELERWFVEFRIKNKIFAEIKWEKVKDDGMYFRCYLEMIEKLLNSHGTKFHANGYKGEQYQASYALVRSISWKLSHFKYKDKIGILFDEKDSREVDKTKELLGGDRNFEHNLIFCTESDSRTFTTMQVVDLLCGAMAYKINCALPKVNCDSNKDKFVTLIEKIDEGLEMNLSFGTLWEYYNSKKIQYYELRHI